MRTAPPSTRYSGVAQSFHWVVAALVVLQFMLAPIPENLLPGIHVDPHSVWTSSGCSHGTGVSA